MPEDKNGRKLFIKKSLALAAVPFLPAGKIDFSENLSDQAEPSKFPMVISTWKHGLEANKAAWEILNNGGKSLDAVEAGVRVSESDPEVMSVGYGGLPDREGHVTLDACIMNSKGDCGAVSFLENIKNPISVARKVMEDTPHIMLSGEGAFNFAMTKGFKKENLLTEKAKERWEKWKNENNHEAIDIHNHDTIGMLAIDEDGEVSGACTTSGLAWKLHGRVGDSPIIGAGLFVDGEVGAATATGKGEAVIKIAGTHLVVELMRQGKSPQEACEIAIKRIARKQKDSSDFQVGFLAVNLKGETGAFALHKGFQYALNYEKESKLIDSTYLS